MFQYLLSYAWNHKHFNYIQLTSPFIDAECFLLVFYFLNVHTSVAVALNCTDYSIEFQSKLIKFHFQCWSHNNWFFHSFQFFLNPFSFETLLKLFVTNPPALSSLLSTLLFQFVFHYSAYRHMWEFHQTYSHSAYVHDDEWIFSVWH